MLRYAVVLSAALSSAAALAQTNDARAPDFGLTMRETRERVSVIGAAGWSCSELFGKFICKTAVGNASIQFQAGASPKVDDITFTVREKEPAKAAEITRLVLVRVGVEEPDANLIRDRIIAAYTGERGPIPPAFIAVDAYGEPGTYIVNVRKVSRDIYRNFYMRR